MYGARVWNGFKWLRMSHYLSPMNMAMAWFQTRRMVFDQLNCRQFRKNNCAPVHKCRETLTLFTYCNFFTISTVETTL
jgi:hypothetical protein